MSLSTITPFCRHCHFHELWPVWLTLLLLSSQSQEKLTSRLFAFPTNTGSHFTLHSYHFLEVIHNWGAFTLTDGVFKADCVTVTARSQQDHNVLKGRCRHCSSKVTIPTGIFDQNNVFSKLPHDSPAASLLATCGRSLEDTLYHSTFHSAVNKDRLWHNQARADGHKAFV